MKVILDWMGHERPQVWDIPEPLWEDLKSYSKNNRGALLSDTEEGRELYDRIKEEGTNLQAPNIGVYA